MNIPLKTGKQSIKCNRECKGFKRFNAYYYTVISFVSIRGSLWGSC